MKHTPGPWHVQEKDGPGYITAEVCYGVDGECITDGVYEIGDANLMAAAPEMCKALEYGRDKMPIEGYTPLYEAANLLAAMGAKDLSKWLEDKAEMETSALAKARGE